MLKYIQYTIKNLQNQNINKWDMFEIDPYSDIPSQKHSRAEKVRTRDQKLSN